MCYTATYTSYVAITNRFVFTVRPTGRSVILGSPPHSHPRRRYTRTLRSAARTNYRHSYYSYYPCFIVLTHPYVVYARVLFGIDFLTIPRSYAFSLTFPQHFEFHNIAPSRLSSSRSSAHEHAETVPATRILAWRLVKDTDVSLRNVVCGCHVVRQTRYSRTVHLTPSVFFPYDVLSACSTDRRTNGRCVCTVSYEYAAIAHARGFLYYCPRVLMLSFIVLFSFS